MRVFETQEKRAALSDTPRIAIVDDDEMVSEATGELIRTYGLAARTFASAEAFLGSDCATRTSRLVADIQMPGANGLQLHRHFTRAGHRIPVIFITTFPDEALRKRALNARATCYLSKPFNPALLLNCIRVAIGPWKPGREA